MLFLTRGKLQVEWDLTFNSMYKLIILLTYLYSNQSLSCFFSYQCNSKKSISNQMGVVDGRAYRVARLVACNKDVYLPFHAPRAFI